MSLLMALLSASQDCEIRVYLLDANKAPAPLRNVTAFVVTGGEDAVRPMVVEVPLKPDEPPAPASSPQAAAVEGTSFTAEVYVFRRKGAGEFREGPYFRAVIDAASLPEDGRFRIVFTIGGERRVARGFTCHAGRTLQEAAAAKDAAGARAAADALAARLEELRAGLDAEDWEKVSRSLDGCRRILGADERRRP